MDISPELLRQLITHAREDPANECCGVVAARGTSPRRAVRVYRTRNIHESPLKFEIDSKELLGIWQQIEGEGLELARSTILMFVRRRTPRRPTSASPRGGPAWSGSSSG
jgi:[CysO sulfur-carrier protein]-S-L-cysteine hydrolase